jgi:hypothetical protein
MPTRIVKKHHGMVVAYETIAVRKAAPTATPVSLQIRKCIGIDSMPGNRPGATEIKRLMAIASYA